MLFRSACSPPSGAGALSDTIINGILGPIVPPPGDSAVQAKIDLDESLMYSTNKNGTSSYNEFLGTGNRTTDAAKYNLIIGDDNLVTAENSLIVGDNNKISGDGMFVIGDGITATDPGSVVIKSFNLIDAANDQVLDPFDTSSILNLIDASTYSVRDLGSNTTIQILDACTDTVL